MNLNKERLKKSSEILKKIQKEKTKNNDPLKKIPEAKIKLYGFDRIHNSIYFDTEEELNEYLKNIDTSTGRKVIIEYLGYVGDRCDVIRKTCEDIRPILYTVIDQYKYGIYNQEQSINKGRCIWECFHGDLRSIYSALRERGIVFEYDIYSKTENINKQLLKTYGNLKRYF